MWLALGLLAAAEAADSDGDTLDDTLEDVNGDGNPRNDDTDGDGVSDHLDPDDDNDTVPTAQEAGAGIVDSDGDGLPDHRDSDDDGDGLSTAQELGAYGTDWLDPDTDGGGTNDGDEVDAGTNPLDPGDDVAVGPNLAPPAPGTAGGWNLWVVRDAPPGASVWVFGSTSTGASAVPGCPGTFAGLGAPVLVGRDTANASGTARVAANVPAALAGVDLWFQAVVQCELTPVVLATF